MEKLRQVAGVLLALVTPKTDNPNKAEKPEQKSANEKK